MVMGLNFDLTIEFRVVDYDCEVILRKQRFEICGKHHIAPLQEVSVRVRD